MNILRALFALFIGCMLGIVGTLYQLQTYEPFVYYVQEQIITQVAAAYKCRIRAQLDKINLFTLTLHFRDMQVSALTDDRWSWFCHSVDADISLMPLLRKCNATLSLKLYNLHATSTTDRYIPAIIEHIRTLVDSPSIVPLDLQSLAIIKGSVTAEGVHDLLSIKAAFDVDMRIHGDTAQLTIYADEGTIAHNQIELINQLHCAVALKIKSGAMPLYTLDGVCQMPALTSADKRCQINGHGNGVQSVVSVHSLDDTINIGPVQINHTDTGHQFIAEGTVPLALIYCLALSTTQQQLSGTLQFKTQGTFVDMSTMQANGAVSAENVVYGSIPLGNFRSTYALLNNFVKLVGIGDYQQERWCSWYADYMLITKTGRGAVQLEATLPLWPHSQWHVVPKDAYCAVRTTADGFDARLHCAIENATQRIPCDVRIAQQEGWITCNGTLGKALLQTRFNLYTNVLDIIKVSPDAASKPALFIKGDKSSFNGTADCAGISKLLQQWVGTFYNAYGKINLNGSWSEQQLATHIDFQEGYIRLPHIYNGIRAAQGTVQLNWHDRWCAVDDLFVQLNKGTARSKHALLQINNAGTLQYAYVPLTVEELLLNSGKDMYALVNGNALLHYSPDNPLLFGRCIVNGGQFKKNILSALTTNAALPQLAHLIPTNLPEVVCDIGVETRNPIAISTPFLEAQAQALLNVRGKSTNPEISGIIKLHDGVLSFPYVPLHVIKGSVIIPPHKPLETTTDPLLEVQAKGTIKNYRIILQVEGNASSPQIMLSASPSLSEEQIITLLLAGSTDGALGIAMPTQLMQDIATLIVGPEQSRLGLREFFKNLLAPLPKIRIVPEFSDQSGRGGFRGAIDIEVNDRLRGMIKKNFSLPEDLKLEVEYLLADEISVRGVQDERGDLGGEVEMRWKF